MTIAVRVVIGRTVAWPVAVIMVCASVLLAACGSSSSSKTAATSPASSASGAATASVTVTTADVAGIGTVLVNGESRTLYLLTSERGGKITCTAANDCTTYWPLAELPAGLSHGVAGSGAQASLLGTVRTASGSLVLTYGGWPLHTFSGDSGPGMAHGQGVTSFGGTWWAISPAGTPVTGVSSTPSTTSHSGYGY